LPPSFLVVRLAARSILADRRFFAVVVLAAAAPGAIAAVAFGGGDARVATLVASFLALYLQLLVTARTLDAAGAMPPGYDRPDATEGRFPSAFLASLLSLVGVALAALLLVVPGVLLYGLWSLWMPALLAERLRATEALRRSWTLARPRLGWVLLVALWVLLAWVAALAPMMGMVLLGMSDTAADVTGELLVAAAQMAGAAIYAHAFMLCRRDRTSGARHGGGTISPAA